ncbi:hypothetical protein JGU71_29335 [Antrihabitans sp. YC3-6]|uniref:Uncharacterized protein n=1 Tax=Antrihabitans stalagmiti TaxID=2799499 RepID=A0A934U7G7_9NOCA|nr:hypothetical protein [Antrihabitans stalagmiti]MBJ8342993.1 hypothetical protein [Antrihabitans stalagmiti]
MDEGTCVFGAAVSVSVDEPHPANAVIMQQASSAAADVCWIVRIFMLDFLPGENTWSTISVAWAFPRI